MRMTIIYTNYTIYLHNAYYLVFICELCQPTHTSSDIFLPLFHRDRVRIGVLLSRGKCGGYSGASGTQMCSQALNGILFLSKEKEIVF